MTLKNLMEDKQLNFDQPFLSVRRGSLIGAPPEANKSNTINSCPKLPSLPYYISDLKSGPIRNPGAVPFQWEQTPGQPKHEKKAPSKTVEHLPLVPRLPPGRIANHKKKPTDNVLSHSPVHSSRSHAEKHFPCSAETSSVEKFEGSEEGKKDENVSSSDDENVVYEDARDTLSRTESFFYNCSISGVSGLDGPNVDPSQVLLDPQTQDFMMGRFLPAAKAVATEAPQYASRKHPVAQEQPEPVRSVVTTRIPTQYDIPRTLPHNVHRELEMEEGEDDLYNYDDANHLPAKLCGLLPRFCLLNPVPGMRDHAHLISSVQSVRSRPVYAGVPSKTVNKGSADNLGEIKRHAHHHSLTKKSTSTTYFGRNGTAPQKNESPQSFLRDRGFLVLPDEPKDISTATLDSHRKPSTTKLALLADHSAEEIASPVNPATEKTLYVDSDPRVDSLDANSSSSESRGRNPSVDYSLQDEAVALSSPEKSSLVNGKEIVLVSPNLQNVGSVVDTRLLHKSHVKVAKQAINPSLALGAFLPKSPSESWLSRTLPSMPLKHPSSKLYLGNVAFKTSNLDPKRDRMLRSSKGQHMFFHSSGELATISEN